MMATPQKRLTTLGAIDAFFGGIGFVLKTPRVWVLALVPAAVLVFLFAGFVGLGIWGSAELGRGIFGTDLGTWGIIGKWLLITFFTIIAILIALLLALSLAEPLSAFALERISRAQQCAITGHAPESPSLFKAMWMSLVCVSFGVGLGAMAIITLLVINVFYPPATVVTIPLKMLVCSWVLAWDLLDYPLALRKMGLFARLKWVFRHFGAFTLFGFLWASCAVVPGIVLVLLPMGVAGATRMVLWDDPRPPNESE